MNGVAWLPPGAAPGVEEQRRAVEAVLGVIALAPFDRQAPSVKTQLMVTRIARRLSLKEETIWARLDELRAGSRRQAAPERPAVEEDPRQPPASPEERELLELLLADSSLVSAARAALMGKRGGRRSWPVAGHRSPTSGCC